MATSTDKGYYKCTIEGDYYAGLSGKGRTISRYKLVFNVPDLGADKVDGHYMSLIKKTLLLKQLKAKHIDAIDFRTYEMYDRVFVSGDGTLTPSTNQLPPKAKSINSMTKLELETHIKENRFNIDLSIHNTVDKMRKAITAYSENSTTFLQAQEDLRAQIDLDNTLNALNPIPSLSLHDDELVNDVTDDELVDDTTGDVVIEDEQ